MNKFIRTALFVAGVASGVPAHAATGNLSIVAGGNFGFSAGYTSPTLGSFPIGSISNPTLSDGKQVVAVFSSLANSQDGFQVSFEVSGFSSDPGAGYFSSLTISTCDVSPSAFTAASAQYTYLAARGIAWWRWGHEGTCFFAGKSYSVTVN